MFIRKVFNQKFGITFLLSVLYVVLLFLYKTYIIKNYSSVGFEYNPSVLKISLSIILFLVSVTVTNLFSSNFVYAVSILLKFLFLIPSLVIFSLMNNNFLIPLSSFLLDIGFVFASKINLKFKSKVFTPDIHLLFLIIILSALLIPFIYTYGSKINLNLLLLKDIYISRLALRKIDTPFGQYPMYWMSKIIIPILLILSISKRKYLLSVASILLLIYIFLVAGAHKSILFSLFVFLGFYFFKDYYKKIYLLLIGVLFMIFFGIIFSASIPQINNLLVRRTILDPALLDTQYFDFFHKRPVYLAHSILKGIIHYPYPVQPSYLIGIEYYHNPATNAGNGIISDGFMNFGMPGVFIELFIAIIILVYLNSLNLSPRFFGLCFIIIYGFNATGILTNILTGGLFLMLLIGQFIIKNSAEKI